MKIVMDFRKFYGVIGGVEQLVIQLTKHITSRGHQVVLLCRGKYLRQLTEMLGNEANLKLIPLPVDTELIGLKNVWIDSVTIQNIAEEEGATVIHFPYNWSFPLRKKVPCILTIHDLIPYTIRESMGFFTNRLLYKPGTRLACRLNDVIATVSEFSKREITEKFTIPQGNIRVIPNGFRQPAIPDSTLERGLEIKYGLGDCFIICVGGIHERKNIVRLIHAFSKLVSQHGYTGKLVVTGSTSGHPYIDRMKRLCDKAIAETGTEGRVKLTGFIPDEELDTLLRHADFLIYPSYYEGFGIPIIEAMQVGTPVITSNMGGTAEVAGDAAALINPYDTDDMTSMMHRLLSDRDLRAELTRRGEKRASTYSWESTGDRYLQLYQDTAM